MSRLNQILKVNVQKSKFKILMDQIKKMKKMDKKINS